MRASLPDVVIEARVYLQVSKSAHHGLVTAHPGRRGRVDLEGAPWSDPGVPVPGPARDGRNRYPRRGAGACIAPWPSTSSAPSSPVTPVPASRASPGSTCRSSSTRDRRRPPVRPPGPGCVAGGAERRGARAGRRRPGARRRAAARGARGGRGAARRAPRRRAGVGRRARTARVFGCAGRTGQGRVTRTSVMRKRCGTSIVTVSPPGSGHTTVAVTVWPGAIDATTHSSATTARASVPAAAPGRA